MAISHNVDLPTPIRVLVVDDNESDFIWIDEELKGCATTQFECEWANSFYEGRRQLTDDDATHFDVALIDYRLDSRSGVQLIKQAVDAHCQIPFIVVTGQLNPQIDRESLDVGIGAADCILKSEIDADVLNRTIQHNLMRNHLMSQGAGKMSAILKELGQVCHGLNSPLLAMLTRAQLLMNEDTSLTQHQQSHLAEIVEQGNLLVMEIRKLNQLAEPALRHRSGSSQVEDSQGLH